MPLPSFASAHFTHPEAVDWARRVSTNGGTISTTLLRAVSDFCAAIDAANIRSAMCRVNLFCGGNLSGCLVPLYVSTSIGGSVLGNSTDTNANFVSADFEETGASGGLKGNGTSKYLDTGFTPASFSNRASVHLSISATSLETTSAANNTTGDRFGIGSYNNTEGGLYDLSIANYTGARGANLRASRFSTFSNFPFTSSSTRGATESHLVGTRTSATASALYGGGSSLNTNTGTSTAASSSQPFYVFCLNLNGTAGLFTAGRFRMYSIGNGLTAAQAASFSSAVATLNTALGR
jgi:hypothetical protein